MATCGSDGASSCNSSSRWITSGGMSMFLLPSPMVNTYLLIAIGKSRPVI